MNSKPSTRSGKPRTLRWVSQGFGAGFRVLECQFILCLVLAECIPQHVETYAAAATSAELFGKRSFTLSNCLTPRPKTRNSKFCGSVALPRFLRRWHRRCREAISGSSVRLFAQMAPGTRRHLCVFVGVFFVVSFWLPAREEGERIVKAFKGKVFL